MRRLFLVFHECRVLYLDQSFTQGLSQVLYSMAVIEIAKPGKEATTYELIISVSNAAITFGGVVSTQLLGVTDAIGCTKSSGCASNTVDVTSVQAYEKSNGPQRFTNYTLLIGKWYRSRPSLRHCSNCSELKRF